MPRGGEVSGNRICGVFVDEFLADSVASAGAINEAAHSSSRIR